MNFTDEDLTSMIAHSPPETHAVARALARDLIEARGEVARINSHLAVLWNVTSHAQEALTIVRNAPSSNLSEPAFLMCKRIAEAALKRIENVNDDLASSPSAVIARVSARALHFEKAIQSMLGLSLANMHEVWDTLQKTLDDAPTAALAPSPEAS